MCTQNTKAVAGHEWGKWQGMDGGGRRRSLLHVVVNGETWTNLLRENPGAMKSETSGAVLDNVAVGEWEAADGSVVTRFDLDGIDLDPEGEGHRSDPVQETMSRIVDGTGHWFRGVACELEDGNRRPHIQHKCEHRHATEAEARLCLDKWGLGYRPDGGVSAIWYHGGCGIAEYRDGQLKLLHLEVGTYDEETDTY